MADYALIAIAALFARPTGATRNSPYKMPFWPQPYRPGLSETLAAHICIPGT